MEELERRLDIFHILDQRGDGIKVNLSLVFVPVLSRQILEVVIVGVVLSQAWY